MQTIEIKKSNAAIAYKNADANGKKLLEQLLGKANVSSNIIEMVNDFNDILLLSGKTMADIQKPGDTPDEVAYKQAKLIADVYNDETVLNALDTDQYKYYPYHKISGTGLSFYGFVLWGTDSTVGVRLCFKSADLAIDAGKKFIEIYTILKTR